MFYADLQIQSKYSGGTSKYMVPERIIEASKKKGLSLVGTGDIQHKEWREELINFIKEKGDIGTLSVDEIYFIPQTEVEIKKVHFVILFRDLKDVEHFDELIKGKYKTYDGRPILDLNFREFEKIIEKLEALYGPAHAFTPYYGIYSYTDEISKLLNNIDFLELGLSSDTYLASLIEELNNFNGKKIPFLSNSDAHSPYPHRLGREFNTFSGKIQDSQKIFDKIKSFKILWNAGLNPEEGKYHMSACNKCKTRFYFKDANKFKWKCPLCKGIIKKGVKDRIYEIASFDKELNDELKKEIIKKNKRPPYYYNLPLSEIISFLSSKSPNSKFVLSKYDEVINKFDNEIDLMFKSSLKKLKEEWEELAIAIEKVRNNEVVFVPGGGGEYGRYYIIMNEEIRKKALIEREKVIFNEDKMKNKLSYWL